MFWITFAIIVAFSILHSWLATSSFKQRLRQQMGERGYHAYYRLLYNVISIVTLAPVGVVVLVRPGETVWAVDAGLRLILLVIQGVGVLGLAISLLQIDLARFGGLRQVMAATRGEALPLADEPLQIGGLYALVRHPLYFFSLLVIWPVGVMSEAWLAVCIGTTVYFIVGSILEERKLLSAYGEVYRSYQERVPWMIPFTKGLLR